MCVPHKTFSRRHFPSIPLAVLHRRQIPFQTGRRVAFQVSDAVVSVTFIISVFPRGHDIKSPQIADPRPPSPFSTITPRGLAEGSQGEKKGDARQCPFSQVCPVGQGEDGTPRLGSMPAAQRNDHTAATADMTDKWDFMLHSIWGSIFFYFWRNFVSFIVSRAKW